VAKRFQFAAVRNNDTVGEGWLWAVLPGADNMNREAYAQRQDEERHDPRHAIKTGGAGSGDNGRSVLLNEALQDQVVIITAAFIDRGLQLVAHFVGVGAADVIALEKDLAASASAHHAVTEIFEAGIGVSGAHEEDDGQGQG
jgi:hypothetical protein